MPEHQPAPPPVWTRTELSGSLTDAWEAEAERWVTWVRTPGHDSYDVFHRDAFRELLPAAPGPLLDVGCGEGRFPRDLKSWGYSVTGVDASPTLIHYARDADPAGDYRVADGAALPFADESFPIVTAFMSLHDMDDAAGAVREASRVLARGGRLCLAIVHPLGSAGGFESRDRDARYVIDGSYLDEARYASTGLRDGLRMTFSSQHRPLQAYFAMLEAAGLVVERLVEVADLGEEPGSRWRRVPLFLHMRASKA